jgi:hypothetical protein
LYTGFRFDRTGPKIWSEPGGKVTEDVKVNAPEANNADSGDARIAPESGGEFGLVAVLLDAANHVLPVLPKVSPVV